MAFDYYWLIGFRLHQTVYCWQVKIEFAGIFRKVIGQQPVDQLAFGKKDKTACSI